MSVPEEETCWSLIRGAATGSELQRNAFAKRYLPILEAYLKARWRGTPLLAEVDDAVQEVFVGCFREGGVLAAADSKHPSGFRAFLYSITRNVARKAERSKARRNSATDLELDPENTPADELTLSRIFDRAYALALMQSAREAMARQAILEGEAHLRRVELLKLRFEDGLPIRDIATQWDVDPAYLHHEYARARKEFRDALEQAVVIAENCPRSKAAEECSRLLHLLKG